MMTEIWKSLEQLNSSELSDAMDSLGIEAVLTGIKPIVGCKKLIGPVYTVKYQPYDKKPSGFKSAADYIEHVPDGAVILIDNEANEHCSTWGGILSQFADLKGLGGTVINGACRDLEDLQAIRYPVYARAVTMRSGKNRVMKVAEQISLNIGRVAIHPGDIIFGDQNGVLVLPQNLLPEVVCRAERIKATEKKIVQAIQEGVSLADARKLYRYDMPWLEKMTS